MKSSKTLLGMALFAILGLLFLYMAGFFTTKLSQEQLATESEYPQFKTVIIETREVNNERQFTGSVSAAQKAILSARITAVIAEVLVDVGSQVQQGDVLMRLESTVLDARVRQTEQALSSAQAQLNVARKEYKRLQQLLNKKLISQSQFDQSESQFKTANANFQQAKARVTEAQTTSGFSIITAPFNGVIDSRAVNRGDTASPSLALLSLYNPNTLQLQADISESLINKTWLNKELRYEIPTFAIKAKGKVIEVSPATDTSSRSFVVKIALNQTEQLFPGNYGKVWVKTGNSEILTVPAQAVYQVGQLDYVKVIEKGEIKTKLVQLGKNNRVRKGLKSGDEVILNPLSL